MTILGLMSGTSMDGLDCCIVRIYLNREYKFNYTLIDFKTFVYPQKIIRIIKDTLGTTNPKLIAKCDDTLGKYFAEICSNFVLNEKIDLIASHGQTISHLGKTHSIQLGNPLYLYEKLNVPVVYNFREKDILLGGEGAPFAPFLDWLIFKNLKKNIITINIGGISNLTLVTECGERSKVVGYDTGPGMSLIDEYANYMFNERCDFNSQLSFKGKVDENLLRYLLNECFINRKPPKSTSREYFGKDYLLQAIKKFKEVNKYDFIRTLVKFTSESICMHIKIHKDVMKIKHVIISGGGAKHKLLVNDLKEKVSNLYTSEYYNISIDAKEALLMAVLGYACYHNIQNNMPSVTGARKLDVYGQIFE